MNDVNIVIESITINGERYNAVNDIEEDSCNGCDLNNPNVCNVCVLADICDKQKTIFKKEIDRV